jgi:hypothetical protein
VNFIFNFFLLCGGETWKTKIEDRKIQTMEIKLLRQILNKTRERIRNNNVRSKLGMDEMKEFIKKSRLRWFGHVMQMTEERILQKMLHTKMKGIGPRWIDKIKNYIEMKEEHWKEMKEKSKLRSGDGRRFLCNTRPVNLETT